jgi:hypothetical protein
MFLKSRRNAFYPHGKEATTPTSGKRIGGVPVRFRIKLTRSSLPESRNIFFITKPADYAKWDLGVNEPDTNVSGSDLR